MTKTIKTMAIAALACVTICGTTLAAPAPKGGRGPAPAHHPAPVHRAVPPPTPPHREIVHVEHHEANGVAALVGGLIGGLVGALAG